MSAQADTKQMQKSKEDTIQGKLLSEFELLVLMIPLLSEELLTQPVKCDDPIVTIDLTVTDPLIREGHSTLSIVVDPKCLY